MGRWRRLLFVVIALALADGLATVASMPVHAAGTADLQLTVSGPATVNLGESAQYDIVVTNAGPDAAAGTVLTANVPDGMTYIHGASTINCSEAGQTLTCQLGSIPSNQEFRGFATFSTQSTATATFAASVTSTETDPTPGDDSASVQTTIGPPVSADLALSSSRSSLSAYDGESSIFLIVVIKNNGPDTSTGATVSFSVPTVLNVENIPCAPAASGETCTLTAGQQMQPRQSFGYGIELAATAAGSGTLSATVTGQVSDPNIANNTLSIPVTVSPSADLSARLASSQPALYAGQVFDASLSVSNAGPDVATGATATVIVPAGLTPDFGGCATSSSGETCSVALGDQPAGTTLVQDLQFTPTIEGSYTVGAHVSSSSYDPTPADDSTSAAFAVQPSADLRLSSSATPNPVVPGHQVTVAIVLTNNGPSTATGVSWSATWSSDAKGGIDFESYSVSGGDCTLSGQTLTCQPGDLTSGQQVTLTIVLQPRSKGTLTVDSLVSSSVHDPSPGDTTATSVVIT